MRENRELRQIFFPSHSEREARQIFVDFEPRKFDAEESVDKAEKEALTAAEKSSDRIAELKSKVDERVKQADTSAELTREIARNERAIKLIGLLENFGVDEREIQDLGILQGMFSDVEVVDASLKLPGGITIPGKAVKFGTNGRELIFGVKEGRLAVVFAADDSLVNEAKSMLEGMMTAGGSRFANVSDHDVYRALEAYEESAEAWEGILQQIEDGNSGVILNVTKEQASENVMKFQEAFAMAVVKDPSLFIQVLGKREFRGFFTADKIKSLMTSIIEKDSPEKSAAMLRAIPENWKEQNRDLYIDLVAIQVALDPEFLKHIDYEKWKNRRKVEIGNVEGVDDTEEGKSKISKEKALGAVTKPKLRSDYATLVAIAASENPDVLSNINPEFERSEEYTKLITEDADVGYAFLRTATRSDLEKFNNKIFVGADNVRRGDWQGMLETILDKTSDDRKIIRACIENRTLRETLQSSYKEFYEGRILKAIEDTLAKPDMDEEDAKLLATVSVLDDKRILDKVAKAVLVDLTKGRVLLRQRPAILTELYDALGEKSYDLMVQFKEMCKTDSSLLYYAPDAIRNDERFMIDLLKNDASVYRYMTDKMRGDKKIFIKALKAQADGKGIVQWEEVPAGELKDWLRETVGRDPDFKAMQANHLNELIKKLAAWAGIKL